MMRAWIGISLYELYAHLKPQGMATLLILDPFIYLLLFIPAMREVVGQISYGLGSVDYAAFALPGILTMSMVTTGISVGLPLYMAKYSGEIEILFSLPVSRWMLLVAKMQATVVRTLVQGLVILGLGSILIPSIDFSIFNLASSLLIATGFGVASSLLFLSISSITHNDQAYHLSVNLLFLPVVFTAPVFYPLEKIPAWLQVVGKLNPLTFAVEAIRGAFLGIGLVENLTNLIGVAIFLVAMLAFARWAFPKSIQ